MLFGSPRLMVIVFFRSCLCGNFITSYVQIGDATNACHKEEIGHKVVIDGVVEKENARGESSLDHLEKAGDLNVG